MIREQTQRTAGTGPNRAEEIYEKCLKRDPLTAEEAYWLYEQAPLQELALTADRVRRAVVPDLEVVTWQIDRNVNITNVCISGCHFCNFHCKPHQTERAFITTLDEYKEKIERMLALAATSCCCRAVYTRSWGSISTRSSSRHSRASIRRYACTPSERPKWRTSPASAASPRSTP